MNSIILQASGDGGLINIFMLVAIVVVFYFFMIRPQAKKAKDAKKFREALGKGDKVITIGGIHGKIIEVKEQYVQIQIANGVEIKVSKSAVSPEMTSGSGESELQKK
ncbi:MAG: preprotein translocase subunit YajC [Flavobacteriales bacterium]|nr:preprotein translocase subunit YajC [Flavobacteriales bacterium]MBT3962697.1 preprotein translocase subunit YajC [Flavobacteriales bacterium]MBT4931302.1 preprotein translocase subunit YajC [Flavobacteriales bacterium]MBT5132987.1 preprotein translocase subunit YajC [Flavobacteriales bacterium]MBT5976814.1 preprotein translocase subunit YajC [Flavobacteriales bacterium]